MRESGENYLETILLLENKQGAVRSIDVANTLGYTKPSVSRAVSVLRKSGLITVDENGRLLLTGEGREKANGIYERHLLISRYLMMTLGIGQDTAEADACRIEHVISGETFLRIKEFVTKSEESPQER